MGLTSHGSCMKSYQWLRSAPGVLASQFSDTGCLGLCKHNKATCFWLTTATGTVEARRTVDIKYDTVNLITGLFVKEGDRVAVNQPVATMDLTFLEPSCCSGPANVLKRTKPLSCSRRRLFVVREAFKEAKTMAQGGPRQRAEANDEALIHLTEADEGCCCTS